MYLEGSIGRIRIIYSEIYFCMSIVARNNGLCFCYLSNYSLISTEVTGPLWTNQTLALERDCHIHGRPLGEGYSVG